MFYFASSSIIAMSLIVYLCAVVPSASGKIGRDTASLSGRRIDASHTKPTRSPGVLKPVHDNRNNIPSTHTPTPTAAWRNRNRNKGTRKNLRVRQNKANVRPSTRSRVATPTKRRRQNEEPTPEPTGDASASTTVYISGANAFALLLPRSSGEMVSNAEEDGVAYCTDGSGCGNPFPNGFITGAAYSAAADGSYVQITGCMDASQFPFASADDGGQFDNRFPNGAQCTFGGYGASFIEQVEPSANRFCLRCCKSADDQENCNSHQDRAGCPVAVPGTYEFGEVGCS